jgi:hypothetical protein
MLALSQAARPLRETHQSQLGELASWAVHELADFETPSPCAELVAFVLPLLRSV